MKMFVGFPITRLRLVIRVSVLLVLAVSIISYYMLLTYTKRLNVCSHVINLLYLKLL